MNGFLFLGIGNTGPLYFFSLYIYRGKFFRNPMVGKTTLFIELL